MPRKQTLFALVILLSLTAVFFGTAEAASCTAKNCRWSPSGTVDIGTNLKLRVDLSGSCSGKTIVYNIYEDDVLFNDFIQSTGTGSSVTPDWTAEGGNDYLSDSEYYFQVYIDGKKYCTSANVKVSGGSSGNDDDDESSSCTAKNCRWSVSGPVTEGTEERLRADFNDNYACEGHDIEYKIYEYDPTANDKVKTISQTDTDSGRWTTVWQDDGVGGGDPEYFFKLYVDGDKQCESSQLTVQKYGQPEPAPQPAPQPTCPALSYPSDRWQRVWYTYSNGELRDCLGAGPDEYGKDFSNYWETSTIAYGRSDSIGFKSSRTINVKNAGTYQFTTCTNDGARLIVNGNMVMNEWHDVTDGYITCYGYYPVFSAGDNKVEIDWYDNSNTGDIGIITNIWPIDPPCTVKSATWSTNTATDGDIVTLTAQTENCNGKTITFDVWEADLSSPDDHETTLTAIASQNTATTTWTANYQSDCILNMCVQPEYYIKVLVDGSDTGVRSGQMHVAPLTKWEYADALWQCIGPGDYASWGDEVTCNVAPGLELFADFRDSMQCTIEIPSMIKAANNGQCSQCILGTAFNGITDRVRCLLSCDENLAVDTGVCAITFLATGYDVYDYTTTIGGGIAAGCAGTPIAGVGAGIGIYEANSVGNLALSAVKGAFKALEKKVARDALETLMLVPNLIKWTGKTVSKVGSAAMGDVATSLFKAFAKADGDELTAKFVADAVDKLPNGQLTKESVDKISEIVDFIKSNRITIDASKTIKYSDKLGELLTSGKLLDKLKVAEKVGLTNTKYPIKIIYVDEFANIEKRGEHLLVDEFGKPIEGFPKQNQKVYHQITLALKTDFGEDSVRAMTNNVLFHELIHAKDTGKFITNGHIPTTEFEKVYQEFFADYSGTKLLTGTDLDEFTVIAKQKTEKFYDAWSADMAAGRTAWITDEKYWLTTKANYAKANAMGMSDATNGIENAIRNSGLTVVDATRRIDALKAASIEWPKMGEELAKNMGLETLTTETIYIISRPPTEWIPSGELIDDSADDQNDTGNANTESDSPQPNPPQPQPTPQPITQPIQPQPQPAPQPTPQPAPHQDVVVPVKECQTVEKCASKQKCIKIMNEERCFEIPICWQQTVCN